MGWCLDERPTCRLPARESVVVRIPATVVRNTVSDVRMRIETAIVHGRSISYAEAGEGRCCC